jgi:hypothetical protein
MNKKILIYIIPNLIIYLFLGFIFVNIRCICCCLWNDIAFYFISITILIWMIGIYYISKFIIKNRSYLILYVLVILLGPILFSILTFYVMNL